MGIEFEVDPSFAPDAYDIIWPFSRGAAMESEGGRFSVLLGDEHVGEVFEVTCRVLSKKTWHRFGNFDDELVLAYKVLPPVDSRQRQ